MKISADKQKLLDDFTSELKFIDGVKAIVLGGSHAVGLATGKSDLDRYSIIQNKVISTSKK
ncbi:MAG: hypothetical protein IPH58_07485 [Sphingobacteriales bacterium]|nr:hypothetical protein [Sphingobacteriales bacterium]